MFRIPVWAFLLWLAASCGGSCSETDKDIAVGLVARVKAVFSSEGTETTLKVVTDKQFNVGPIYPFISDLKGRVVAHGWQPLLVGKDLMSLRDQNGRHLTRAMIDIAIDKGAGWISYKWPDPYTHKIRFKTAYIERMGDYFIGVGVTEPD